MPPAPMMFTFCTRMNIWPHPSRKHFSQDAIAKSGMFDNDRLKTVTALVQQNVRKSAYPYWHRSPLGAAHWQLATAFFSNLV